MSNLPDSSTSGFSTASIERQCQIAATSIKKQWSVNQPISSKHPSDRLHVDVAVVLGSGLGELPEALLSKNTGCLSVPYSDIPGFQSVAVDGHKGQLLLLKLLGKWTAFLQGRFHYYEGHSMEQVVFPVRVLKILGATTLMLTNAAGGINPDFSAGDLMLISDHLNLMGDNPLRGKNDALLGARFPDMSEAYTPTLRKKMHQFAAQHKIDLKEGVYAGMSGPCYETPAEVRMLKALGADAVGMSTVPEVIAARHMGMNVLGLSCITNAAAGVKEGAILSHNEVIDTAHDASRRLWTLITHMLLNA